MQPGPLTDTQLQPMARGQIVKAERVAEQSVVPDENEDDSAEIDRAGCGGRTARCGRVRKNEIKRKGTRTTIRRDDLEAVHRAVNCARMAALDFEAAGQRAQLHAERAQMQLNELESRAARVLRRLTWHENVRDWVSAEARTRLRCLEPWPPWLKLRAGEPL